jgi:hypothetical protein
MLDQQHAVMLAFDRRDRHSRSDQNPQHRRFHCDRRTSLGHGAPAVGPPEQQHLRQIPAGKTLQPLLRHPGELSDPGGKGTHPPAAIARANPFAPSVTSAQAASKRSASP